MNDVSSEKSIINDVRISNIEVRSNPLCSSLFRGLIHDWCTHVYAYEDAMGSSEH